LRTLGLARVTLTLALGGVIAGCGGEGPAHVAADRCASGRWLTVYSALPMAGADARDMAAIVGGERIALYAAHKRAGPCNVQLEPSSDASGAAGDWQPGLTTQIAQRATADPGALAYIGDFDSGATATSLQITNAADTLQISPWSPYVGFSDTGPADDEGDPQRYQQSGHNTFARLVPSDYNQASAIATFMAYEGVRRLYVLGDVSDPFDADVAQLIANAAPQAAVSVVGYNPRFNTATNTQPQGYATTAAGIAAERADAVVLGGRPDAGSLALWTELHRVLPHAKLFAPSTLATPAFLAHLGAAASATYVASPILRWSEYPPLARRVKAAFDRLYHYYPNQFVLYGYDAMQAVLDAAKAAGSSVTNPASLRYHLFHLGQIHGALGDYTIYPDGNTSLNAFDGYQVTPQGQLAFVHSIPVG